MNIQLPEDIERALFAKVQNGLFPSMDAATAEAVRLLLERIEHDQILPRHETRIGEETPDPLLGIWHDYADEMDTIVADAYRRRRGDDCILP